MSLELYPARTPQSSADSLPLPRDRDRDRDPCLPSFLHPAHLTLTHLDLSKVPAQVLRSCPGPALLISYPLCDSAILHLLALQSPARQHLFPSISRLPAPITLVPSPPSPSPLHNRLHHSLNGGSFHIALIRPFTTPDTRSPFLTPATKPRLFVYQLCDSDSDSVRPS